MTKWDKRFLNLAAHVSQWSKDPSTQVGCCITDNKNRIVSVGYNGFPRGVSDKDEYLKDRGIKNQMVVHAEENAILFAKQDLTNCSLYVWPFPSCSRCAASIIQSNIKKVVAPEVKGELKARWEESLKISERMFEEAGVELVIYSN